MSLRSTATAELSFAHRFVRHQRSESMGKQFDEITPELTEWLREQKLFFVATAPISPDGALNCSPKGMDTFRILGSREVGYLDLTGSGIETAAHLSENGRIVIMFCAFTGPPKIVRFHGRGSYHPAGLPAFEQRRSAFPILPGTRGIVSVEVSRISDSCGFAVPLYEFQGERDTLVRWAESKGSEGLKAYRQQRNAKNIDGLPGLGSEEV